MNMHQFFFKFCPEPLSQDSMIMFLRDTALERFSFKWNALHKSTFNLLIFIYLLYQWPWSESGCMSCRPM